MKIRIVDAFTDRPFAGNPAGVVLLGPDGFPEDHLLQEVAAEVNLSETAFAHPLPPGGAADWALRWFTPATEVRLCGHATLATAHVLRSTPVSGPVPETVRFATLSGVLTATAAGDSLITLDFPRATLTPVADVREVSAALGAPVLAAYDTGSDMGDLLVQLTDESTVRALAPDFAAVARLPHRGVIATAMAQDPAGGYDFVSRFFGPSVGIDEDPVTGSAHTALAPLWSGQLGRDELVGLQVSARTGRVHTAVRGERVELTGTAVTVIDGQLLAGLE